MAWSYDNGPVVACATGSARLIHAEPATAGTSYPWFSVTKLFTATAALQLVAAGKLGLDEPVSRQIDDLSPPEIASLTPRQLLSHTSGLANPMPLKWVHLATERGPDIETMTRRLLRRHRKLRFAPGSRYGYSNLGYLILGWLIQRISSMSFEEYILRKVLEPLGAESSGFGLPAAAARGYFRIWSWMGLAARVLLGRKFFGPSHDGYGELQPFVVDGAPYGGLIGPVTDMLRLGRAMLAAGTADGGPVLEAGLAKLALAPFRASSGENLPIGLGWHLGDTAGEPWANHVGGGAGFRSELRIYPRSGSAIAIIANETSFDTSAVTRIVAGTRPYS